MTDPSYKDPAHPLLIVTGGPRDGADLALESIGFEKVLGSGTKCHLRLEVANVESEHARVVWDERGVVISDQGTATGTYVNGEKIGVDHHLADGDRVCLGPPGSRHSVKLLVRIPASVAAESEALRLNPPDEFVLESAIPDAADAPEEVFVVEEVPAATPAAPPEPRPAAAVEPKIGFAPEKPRPRPEYTLDQPSIVPALLHEPEPAAAPPHRPAATPVTDGALLKLAKARTRPSLKLPALPTRGLLIGGVVAAVVGVVFLAYWLFLHAPRPALSAAKPDKVEPGQSITLTGTGFHPRAERNTVRIGEHDAVVTVAGSTQLTATVPAELGQAEPVNVSVTVKTRGGVSNPLTLRVGRVPVVTALEPDVALPGQEVVVHGRNLQGKVSVVMGGLPVDVVEARGTVLRIRVPNMGVVEGKALKTVVSVGKESATPLELTLGRLPLVTETQPTRGPSGTRVTLRGRGFDASPAGNRVTFGNEPALVLAVAAGELVVAAPAPPASGAQVPVSIVIEAKGGRSSGASAFQIERPSSGSYLPRFLPAPVSGDAPGEVAFVSTELGPVLLLGTKDDAPSTAERAFRVAEALNGVFSQSGALSFEARTAPAPSVGLAGRPETLLRVTPEDAAAYAGAWDPAMKGQHPAPAELARHWAAVLQDYRILFVERQRPSRVMELSSRGKVLMDLYAESERRLGPGQGVPYNLVSPPAWNLLRDLREMALVISTRGQASAAAIVTGRWQGTSEETDVGTRPLTLLLRLDGPKLAGTLTTRSGPLAMDIPLSQVSYEKGVLNFAVAGGAPRRFRGSVQGSTLSGTIQLQNGQEVGRFTLRYEQ